MNLSQVLVIVGMVILIVLLMYARRAMRRAVYQKMNQPGKPKSALQKFFGW